MEAVIQKLKSQIHKDGVDKLDWHKVHPNLIAIAEFVMNHCDTHNLPLIITSIIRPMIKGISRTNIHAHGRAFDISIRGWSEADVTYLRDTVNKIFSTGAFSVRDGLERESVYEDGKSEGTAPHLHFQVRP